jgi:membrane protease YdiL (CAAX protease family)
MKRCSYCGKEYPDEAALCSVDREPLVEIGLHPQLPPEQTKAADKDKPYLTFPDYQWSARDAWKCLGMILVFLFAWRMVISTLDWRYHGFYTWLASGFGFFSMVVFHHSIELLVAAYFARTETLATFWKGFGLDRKPSEYVWNGIVAALVLRFIGYFMISHGWGKGVTDHDIIAFKHTLGPERYLFLAPLLLLAPLFEESINRGFLYKAFRGSYAMGTSIVLILAWTAFTHWSQYSHSWVAAVDLSLLTVVQCYLREKSDSLWDCIFCHFAFNFSLLFVGGTLR